RPVASLLARGRDHRRNGISRRRGGRRGSLRARLLVRRRLPAGHGRQLLHAVLGRPDVRAAGARPRVPTAGPVRAGGMTRDPKTNAERAIGVGALVVAVLAPLLFSDFWLNAILTQGLILGIGAASLIFLSAYGGMISLAQTGLMGIAGYALANMVTQRVPGGE